MNQIFVSRQRGFSLMELMVGLTIGLFVLLTVFQVYTTWDGRQRTGGSKSDAQIAGTQAAFALERDLRLAGLGFGAAAAADDPKVGCTVNAFFTGGAPQVFTFTMLPIQIVNGAAGAPDQLDVLYGTSAVRSLREIVVGSDPTTKYLLNRAGMLPGDFVMLSNSTVPNSCQLVEVTHADPAVVGSPRAFWHRTVAYQSAYTAAGVLTNPTMNPAGGTAALEFDEAFNLGPAPRANRWSIGGATPLKPFLQRINQLPTNAAVSVSEDIAEGIVNLQAQYGYDADDNGQIAANEWVDAIVPGPPDWRRVLAVRYALLARSRNFEALPFRAANPVWAGGRFVMTDLSGGADTDPGGANNWRAYRHVVYEGVIPMRNVLWGRLL